MTFQQVDTQSFQDKSEFGELTWHFVQGGQVTVGARHFSQQFTDAQSYDDYPFPTHLPATPHESPASKTVGKVNPSYEYAPNQYVYAVWSQGFRRGGANSVPLAGPFRESPLLATYAPDSTNNYEAGLKGRFGNGFSYTAAVFDIKWDKPQISSSLPSGNLAVYNGNTAESKGFELESSGPLFVPLLSYTVSFAYADAHLTSSFSLPANNGLQTGTIVPGLIHGSDGQQMPGSPKTSASVALNYDMPLSAGYELALDGERRVPQRGAHAADADARCHVGAVLLELRDRELLRRAESRALANDALHHQSLRQAEHPGAADAVQRARQADERLRGESAARDRPAAGLHLLKSGSRTRRAGA